MSAYISFELFIRPMIRTLLGVKNVFRATVKAQVTCDIESPIGLTSLIRALLFLSSDGSPMVTPLADQEDLLSLSRAGALITVAADSPGYLKGELAEIIILDRSL